MSKKSILIHGIPQEIFYQKLAERKDLKKIYVTEFRPNLWGAKIVCKELIRRKLTPILVCDNMVGFCLGKKMLDEIHIFTKAIDEKAALCLAGSLIYAICAKKNKAKIFCHRVGKVKKAINAKDILSFCGQRVAAKGIKGYVALWESVPKELIQKFDDETKSK